MQLTLGDRPPVTLKGRHRGPHASITISNRKILWRLVTVPDLAFGEAYMDGHLTVPENGLEPLVDLLMTNSNSWATHWTGRATLQIVNALAWLRHLNPRGRSRRNVAHHYDLSDALFDCFLDPWRQYLRMWEFYLVGCEYFFRRQHGMVLQLQLAKDQMAAPMSRHYIRNRENEFKDRLWTLHLSGN